MKKLLKLQISSEKLLKNHELLILRGGYDDQNCQLVCDNDDTCKKYSGGCLDCRPGPTPGEYRCQS